MARPFVSESQIRELKRQQADPPEHSGPEESLSWTAKEDSG